MKSTGFSSITLLILAVFMSISCRGPESHRYGKERIVLQTGEVHEGWYFAGGNQVIIDGTVNGDAYVAGGLVEINGTINGTLFVAGGQVTVSGAVKDRIIGAGGTLRFEGKTDKGITVAGGSILLGKNASVGEYLLAAGGNLEIDGTVGRDAKIAGGQVDIAGTIKGNLDAAADQFALYRGAVIDGNLDLVTRDSTTASIQEGTVHGKLTVSTETHKAHPRILGMSEGAFWFKTIYVLSLFATALALAFALPRQLATMGTTIIARPGQTLLVGFILLIMIPVAAVVLCATVVGVPLGLFVLVIYLWLLYLSQLTLGVALADILVGVDGKAGWRLFFGVALGLLVVQFLTYIPYLKTLIALAGLVMGLGALGIMTRNEFTLVRTRHQGAS